MAIHLGNIVSLYLKQRGIKKTVFATKMNYSKQNVDSLLKKENWYIGQVKQASLVLGINLFKELYFDKDLSVLNTNKNDENINTQKISDLEKQIMLLNNSLKDKQRIIDLLEKKK